MAATTLCPRCGTAYTQDASPDDAVHCGECGAAFTIGYDAQQTERGNMPSAVGATELATRIGGDAPSSGGGAKGAPAILAPGQTVGRCIIEKELGRGGMGAVYLARHTTLDVPVAVKVILPQVVREQSEFAERFIREAKLAARIRHANIVAVMDAGQDEETGLCYIVMECVDGGSVQDLIKQGPLPIDRAVEIILGVARALEAAHRHNIIHRDIKPANIMLSAEGEAKLADLGLAKQAEDAGEGLTQSQAIMGTPAYMSQEQVAASKHVDIRADIYSLGATLYHMLIGHIPYKGDTTLAILQKLASEPTPDPRSKRPDVPEPVAAACMKMMAKKAEDRYQTPAELIDALEQVRRGEAVAAAPAQFRGGLWLAAAAVVLVTGVAGIAYWLRMGASPAPLSPPTPLVKPQTPTPPVTSQTPTPPEPPKPDPVEALLREAASLREEGHWAQALAVLNESAHAHDKQVQAMILTLREAIQTRTLAQEAAKEKAQARAAYDAAMKDGKARLATQQWAAAEASFTQALAVEGYADDAAAQAGMKQAQAGVVAAEKRQAYAAAVRAGREALARSEWDKAQQAFSEALQVSGIEDPTTAREGLKQANDGAAHAKQFARLMERGVGLVKQKRFDEALQAYAKAQAVPGFAADARVREGLQAAREAKETAARQASFDAALTAAKGKLQDEAWAEAVPLLEQALAIPGFATDAGALKLLAYAKEQAQAAANKGAALTVTIRNLKGKQGRLMVGVFDTPMGFPLKHDNLFRQARLDITGDPVTAVVEDLPPGTYAVAVFQDLDESLKLETGAFGIPKEPWGVSNNVKGRFGPPTFKDAKFEMTEKPKALDIKLNQ